MSGPILTFIVILGIVVVIRGFSVVARRRQFRSRGMNYPGSWIGDIFGQSGGGHHGHHGGGWGGGHNGGHHGGGGGGHGGGGGGHHG